MNRIISILLFLVGFSSYAQNAIKGEADYQIHYDVNFVIDSTDRDERTTEMHHLFTGSDVSYYASDAFLRLDTLMTQFRENPEASRRQMRGSSQDFPRPEFLPKVYKNLKNSEVLVSVRLMMDNYSYQEQNLPLTWEMGEETKTIGEYEAQKATTRFGGRKWTAWFTLQVPIQDGPYIFSGLPGLILELSDTDEDFQFNVSSIKPLKKKFAIDSETSNFNNKNVKKEAFIKAYKNYRENPLGEMGAQMRNMNIELPDPRTGEMVSVKDFLRSAKREAQRRNNYIERI